VGRLGACVKYHCDFPFFFSFLHHAYRSPRLTDFHDLYVKRRVFAHENAFWGSRWWISTFSLLSPPKFDKAPPIAVSHEPQCQRDRNASTSLYLLTMMWTHGVYFAYVGRRNPWTDRVQILFAYLGTQDVITCIKFGDDRLRGFWWTGCQTSCYPIDFEGRPYNSASVRKNVCNVSKNVKSHVFEFSKIRKKR